MQRCIRLFRAVYVLVLIKLDQNRRPYWYLLVWYNICLAQITSHWSHLFGDYCVVVWTDGCIYVFILGLPSMFPYSIKIPPSLQTLHSLSEPYFHPICIHISAVGMKTKFYVVLRFPTVQLPLPSLVNCCSPPFAPHHSLDPPFPPAIRCVGCANV